MSETEKFGDILRRLRIEKAKNDPAFSPSAFAKMVNITPVALHKMEEDGVIPDGGTIRKMADALAVSPAELSLPAGKASFAAALPVWPRGRREKMNDFVLFTACFTAEAQENIQLRITGSTCFRIKFNGEFAAHGPMRGPKGYFRISELPLTVIPGENRVEIEVSGANINSFDFMDQPSFLQAEIRSGDRILAATGRDFAAFDLAGERIRKVTRYSYQRMFFEAYRMTPERKNLDQLELEICPSVNFLPARLPEPAYKIDKSYRPVKTLRRTYADKPQTATDRAVNLAGEPTANRAVTLAGQPGYKGFTPQEVELNAHAEIARYRRDDNGTIVSTLYRGKINNTGFIKLRLVCHRPGRLVVLYDELASPDGGVDPFRLDLAGGVFFELQEPGVYDLETMEPVTFKFAEIFMHN